MNIIWTGKASGRRFLQFEENDIHFRNLFGYFEIKRIF